MSHRQPRGKSASPKSTRRHHSHARSRNVNVAEVEEQLNNARHPSRLRPPSKLRCCNIRWFYRDKNDNGYWTPFKGSDSMKLEIRYRRVNGISIDEYSLRDLSKARRSALLNATVAVLEGLFGISDDFRTLHSIYWKGDECNVRRGTWFFVDTLQPLDNHTADAIEAHHLKFFGRRSKVEKDSDDEDDDASSEVITTLKLPSNEEVRWKSSEDVCLYSVSKLRYLGGSRKGRSLIRGYNTKCDWDDGEHLVRHLILIVHGIGQKQSGSIAQQSNLLRNNMETIFEKRFAGERKRIMIVPVDWRASLSLDHGLTEAASLPKIWELREFANLTLMDIMYYQSPRYRNELICGLTKCLNEAYTLFRSHYPDFRGKVSIFAHSLGTVMCYDILSGYSPIVVHERLVSRTIEDKMKETKDEDLARYNTARLKFFQEYGRIQAKLEMPSESLKFEVRYLFCVGSPLAIFLIMRGDNTVISKSLRVKRLYNIFHPYDPVAYRLEPLIHLNYQKIQPVELRSATDDDAMLSYDQILPQIWMTFLKLSKKRQKKAATAREERPTAEDEDDSSSLGSSSISQKEGGFDASELPVETNKLIEAIPIDRRLPYRIDYLVQPQMTEVSFVSMFSSHTSYWYNVDVAAFVISQLYGEHPKHTHSDGRRSAK